MNVVYIVLAIAVVAVVIGAVVIFRRQAGPVEETAPRPSSKEPVAKQAEEAPARPEAEEAPAKAREGAGERASAAGEAEAPAEPVPEAPPPKPEPTPEELREEAEKLLAESDRMLDELRELRSGGEDESENGTIEVLSEGLQEVKSLVSRDQWAQAKEKGEALKSQLVMMLRSTRREQES